MEVELEKFLLEMGLEKPKAKPVPVPVERQFKGIWYRDGDIPH